jgi:hypothetical protein
MPKYVEAVFEFAGSDGQLSFWPGQLIEVTQEGEPNEWWEGMLDGQAGWFPSAYCSPAFEEGMDATAATEGEAESGALQKQARALYDFPASAEDELGFKIGDLISVSDAEGSWWTGSLNGQSGTFPSNYVDLLEAGGSATAGGGDDLASRLAAALATSRRLASQPQTSPRGGGLLSRALSNSKMPAHAAPISNTLVSLDPSQQLDDDAGDDWDAAPQALLQPPQP